MFAVGCDNASYVELDSLDITNKDNIELEVGYTVRLKTNAPNEVKKDLDWATSNSCVSVDDTGFVTAKSVGKSTVVVSYGSLSDSVIITVVEGKESSDDTTGDTVTEDSENAGGITYDTDSDSDSDTEDEYNKPIVDSVDEAARDAFYGNADPADSYSEAVERSRRGELSGATKVPDQAPTISSYQPKSNGKLIRNSDAYFADANTYVVVNAYGQEVFRVYRGGGYITLEEVAAYVYAFGDIPANYSASKNTSPQSSIWGENLRVNHTKFSGSTSKYPYEPKLPNISGCGGTYQYMEIDIGTTGTNSDPRYPSGIYNNGYSIDRGAARIVYARYDINGNRMLEPDEKYVFYTYNHYNDFQEYLNYYGGWGEMFGNITGGGTISSKYDYNPTPYVAVVMQGLRADSRAAVVLFFDFRRYDDILLNVA